MSEDPIVITTYACGHAVAVRSQTLRDEHPKVTPSPDGAVRVTSHLLCGPCDNRVNPVPEDDDVRCFLKARDRGLHTFTLIGQDLSAPAVICEWIKINIQNSATPDDKLRDALEDAIAMRNTPSAKRKHPD